MYLEGGFTKENYQALLSAALDAEEPAAMYELGMAWAIIGTKQADEAYISKGITMLEKAVENGYAMAACYLGTVYQEGKFGTTPDMITAVKYYKQGAEGGNALAMSNYGIALQRGDGGLKANEAEAFSWLKKAADTDESLGIAQYNVALACHAGRGTKIDRVMAKEYFQRAANAGIRIAHTWLRSEDYNK